MVERLAVNENVVGSSPTRGAVLCSVRETEKPIFINLFKHMENSNYNLNVFCTNCNFKGTVEIPQGIKVNNHPCSKCGNKTLEKIPESARIIPSREDYR